MQLSNIGNKRISKTLEKVKPVYIIQVRQHVFTTVAIKQANV